MLRGCSETPSKIYYLWRVHLDPNSYAQNLRETAWLSSLWDLTNLITYFNAFKDKWCQSIARAQSPWKLRRRRSPETKVGTSIWLCLGWQWGRSVSHHLLRVLSLLLSQTLWWRWLHHAVLTISTFHLPNSSLSWFRTTAGDLPCQIHLQEENGFMHQSRDRVKLLSLCYVNTEDQSKDHDESLSA